uniref:Uncharacterized protein n=1 Tax=Anguilla anguilla TaxID=7936 RepID=A0A0E9UIQ9_ANGAN
MRETKQKLGPIYTCTESDITVNIIDSMALFII